MTNFQISVLCLIATVVIYFANKRLYRRFRALPLMPLVFTPILLVPSGLAAASANGVVTERTARLRWISSDRVNSRASQTELHTATTVAVTTPALSDIQWRLIMARLS